VAENPKILAETTSPLEAALTSLRAHLAQLEEAESTFTADTQWTDGTRIQAAARTFTWTVDEPPQLGGADQGPNPVEFLLAALGACQGIVYSAFATLLRIPLTRLRVRVEGRLDPRGFLDVAKVPVGLTAIHYTVDVDSSATDEEIRHLHALVETHCPVLATLTQPPKITSTLTHNGTQLAM
jgi:putative redox protein